MKHFLFSLALLFLGFFCAYGQNYTVDVLFKTDSTTTVCKPVIPKDKKFKNKEEEMAAREKIYLHEGETVQVLSASPDSMGFVKFMAFRDVHIKYNGKEYTTKASILKLSEDNPEGTVDTVYQFLDTHPGLWNLNIRGWSRHLFSVWLIVIMLIVGILGAVATSKFGKFGLPFFVIPMLFFWWYVANLGGQSYWFMDDMAWGHRLYYYLFFVLIEAFVFFGGKTIWNLLKNRVIGLGLLLALLFLPVLFVAVWGALATQWLTFVIIGAAYLWVTGIALPDDGNTGFVGGLIDAVDTQQKEYQKRMKEEEKRRRQGLL